MRRHARSTPSGRRSRAAAIVLTTAALVLVLPGGGARAATLSVNCDTGGDLQAKIDAASTGDTILVKGTCVGNFIITSKTLTLKGNPTATLEGNDVFRPLGINNTATPARSVHLIHLTITGGVTQGPGGGGILKLGGNLTLDGVTVTNNLSTSSSGPIAGGGIFSGGNLTITNSTISGNRARTTDSGDNAFGGGIATISGKLTITDSTITGNRSTSQVSVNPDARGGGFYVTNGDFSVTGSTISSNRATASGPNSAEADGGGGYEDTFGKTGSVVGTAFIGNTATAVSPGSANVDGAGLSSKGPVHATGSSFSANGATANGPTGALAAGGGLAATFATLTRSTINGNRLLASSVGGPAGVNGGGVVVANDMTVISSTISRNVARATSVSALSNADGGGTRSFATTVTNSTIALNKLSASGDSVAVRGGGMDLGSGSTASVVDSTVAGNHAAGTGNSVEVHGGGLYSTSAVSLEATILAGNTALKGPDCNGSPTSHGHNLIRKAIGCSFTKKPTDKVGVDPKLGVLANNGGPTQTIAIALTSPARDAILPGVCAVSTDQRGVHRPQGPKCDIGAYERKFA